MPISRQDIPRHVAIIMDGNGRWAKKRFLPRVAGHQQGVRAVRAVIRGCIESGVEALTLFAFSSENWQRPEKEVSTLMGIFLTVLEREVQELHEHGIRLRILGDRSRFTDQIRQAIDNAEALTAGNNRLLLNVAADYGGRWDIVQASRQIAMAIAAGELKVEEISEATLGRFISTADGPELDLLIRTGGEKRISNFLLWQAAYAELYFTDTLWPDFDEEALRQAILDFAGRERRFGKTSEQVQDNA